MSTVPRADDGAKCAEQERTVRSSVGERSDADLALFQCQINFHVRADGRFELHIHAHVTTEDGEHLSFFADGVAVPQADTPVSQLRESGSFVTASPKYAWLNHVQVWAHGTVDPVAGDIRVKGYAA